MNDINKVTRTYLDIINQIFEIEKKAAALQESNTIHRNVNRLKEIMAHDIITGGDQANSGLTYHNPIGEDYSITRTDCEASIAGESTENLYIAEVIKPIIRLNSGSISIIVQKAIVVVKSKNTL